MKKIFWNVLIERDADGTVRAAVVKSRASKKIPRDRHESNQWREVYSIWFDNETEAKEAVKQAQEALDPLTKEAP
jgi:hypothetical protein